jgi:hypothetical protein
MTASPSRPSAATMNKVRESSERTLTADEVRARLAEPVSEEERAETLALIRWFRRRYPTGADRLAYVRRAYARWRRARGE